MIINQKIGRLNPYDINQQKVDYILLEWYETRKRIWRKTTQSGIEISMKFLDENPDLTEGDILFADDTSIIAVLVNPCECIVVQPKNMFEVASVCYEIDNKHLPLFYEKDLLLVPFEMPLYNLLISQGYNVQQEKRKLIQPLKTTVSPHGGGNSDSLFSKIMKLTSPSE